MRVSLPVWGIAAVSAGLAMGCGSSSSSVPNFGEVAKKIPPITNSSSAAFLDPSVPVSTTLFSLPTSPAAALTYDTDGFSTLSSTINSIFGKYEASASQMLLSVQLKNLEDYGTELAKSYYDDSSGFKNCTSKITSTTAGLPSTAFPSDAIFWASGQSDSGKYTCLIKTTSGSYNYITLAGREALAASSSCSTANNYGYYLIRGYSTGNSTTGDHQLVRIYMNGCTRDVKFAMTLMRKTSGTASNVGRFEFTGNPDTYSFVMRAAQFGSSSGTMMEGAGVNRTTSGTGNFVLKLKACSSTASTCSPSTTKTMCMQVGTTEGSFTQLSSGTTACDTHETNFNTVSSSTNGFEGMEDLNTTWIDMSDATQFGT